MTDPQEMGDGGCLSSYIGGCHVRARDNSNPIPYVHVCASQIGAEAPNHEIDIPTDTISLEVKPYITRCNEFRSEQCVYWRSYRARKPSYLNEMTVGHMSYQELTMPGSSEASPP